MSRLRPLVLLASLPLAASPVLAARTGVEEHAEQEGVAEIFDDGERPGDLPSGAELARFGQALSALDEGRRERVSVGVFGASHVERQKLTDRIRQRLQGRYGDRGPGFVDPGTRRLQKRSLVVRTLTGRHQLETGHRKPRGEVMSLSGHRLRLYGGAAARFDTCARCRQHDDGTRSLELTFIASSGTAPLVVTLDGAVAARIDPLPPGVPPYVGSLRLAVRGPRHIIEVAVPADAGELTATVLGLVVEREQPGVVVDALGLSGATGVQLGRYDAGALEEQAALRRYDLVIFAWGTNDVLKVRDEERYGAALERSMERVLLASPDADCVYLGPTDRLRDQGGEWVSPPGYASVGRVQRALAAKHGCQYIDARELMGGRGAMARFVEKGFGTDDRVHLTGRGYRWLADRVLDRVLVASGRPPLDPPRVASRPPEAEAR